MKKKDNTPLILYEKYKKDNGLNEISDQEIPITVKKKLSFSKIIWNFIMFGILIGMIILSAVGMITVLHPEIRKLFFEIILK